MSSAVTGQPLVLILQITNVLKCLFQSKLFSIIPACD